MNRLSVMRLVVADTSLGRLEGKTLSAWTRAADGAYRSPCGHGAGPLRTLSVSWCEWQSSSSGGVQSRNSVNRPTVWAVHNV